MQPWIFWVKFEPIQFDFDQPHAIQRQGRHQESSIRGEC